MPRRLNSIFYKISKEGYPDSGLFGTIHVPKDSYFCTDNVLPTDSDLFQHAEQVIVEFSTHATSVTLGEVCSEGEIKRIKAFVNKLSLGKHNSVQIYTDFIDSKSLDELEKMRLHGVLKILNCLKLNVNNPQDSLLFSFLPKKDVNKLSSEKNKPENHLVLDDYIVEEGKNRGKPSCI